MLTEPARRSLEILRDPSAFEWPVVPLFLVVLYIYAVEVERGNLRAVRAGLALLLTDVLWEVSNALILHFTRRSPLWAVTGGTSFLILPGWTIEIALMFAIGGIVTVKFLPADRGRRIFGLPNRWFFVATWSLLGATVESLLVRTPHFHWGYPWWNFPLVALIGYAPFEAMAFAVHDATPKAAIRTVAALAAVDAAAIVVFGPVLGWI